MSVKIRGGTLFLAPAVPTDVSKPITDWFRRLWPQPTGNEPAVGVPKPRPGFPAVVSKEVPFGLQTDPA